MRDWGGIGSVVSEARAIDKALAETPRVDCPVCGTPLDQNSRGAVNCPLGHYYRDARPTLRDEP
jgi:hypothetical protein